MFIHSLSLTELSPTSIDEKPESMEVEDENKEEKLGFNPRDQVAIYEPLLELTASCLTVKEQMEDATFKFLVSLKSQLRTLISSFAQVSFLLFCPLTFRS